MTCNEPHWQEALAEYAAGAREFPPALKEHLAACPTCQEEMRYLRAIEAALAAWPLAEPDPTFLTRLLERLALEEVPIRADQVLPWSIWVPAMTLGAALMIAAIALPPQVPQAWGPALAEWPRQVAPWAAAPHFTLDPSPFWAVWTGLFVAVGGIGLTLALSAWNDRYTQRVEDLKRALSEAADHLLKMAHPMS